MSNTGKGVGVCSRAETVMVTYSFKSAQIHICQHLSMGRYTNRKQFYTSICSVCLCHDTPGRGLQRFRLSATVSGHHSTLQCGRTRGSLVETEGAREGAEWRRAKEKRGERGSDCASRAVRLYIRLESITHTAVHFPSLSRNNPTTKTPEWPPSSVIPPPPSVTLLSSTHLTLFHPASLIDPLYPCPSLLGHALT